MRQIFVDLDGVLADFDGHYEALFGARPDRKLLDPPGFWENIHGVGTFFADLPVMKDGLDLWRGVHRFHPKPIILTGLPKSVTGVEAQKREWVRRNIGDAAVVCTLSKDKRMHGKPGDILIDDWDRYRSHWEEMGGVFLLHTSAAETLARLEEMLEPMFCAVHKWKTQRTGGDPSEMSSYERVTFCQECGIERGDD